MTIYIVTKNEDGSFTRWAETNNQAGLFKLAQYFASSCYCEDFIILFKEDNYAIRFTGYCDQMGIPIRFKRKEGDKT